jgi:hypothetical protein
MRYVNEQIITAANVASTTTSQLVPASNLYRCSVQFALTGSPSATAVLQASNDVIAGSGMNTGHPVPTNWVTLGSSVSLSSASPVLIPSQETCYQWLQVVVTGGGTGTVTVTLQGQGY